MASTIVKIGIILIVYTIVTGSVAAAPIGIYYRTSQNAEVTRPRIFYSALGDILESFSFLPITINVPDLISGAWSYVSGWLPWGGVPTGTKKPLTTETEAGPTRQEVLDYILY